MDLTGRRQSTNVIDMRNTTTLYRVPGPASERMGTAPRSRPRLAPPSITPTSLQPVDRPLPARTQRLTE